MDRALLFICSSGFLATRSLLKKRRKDENVSERAKELEESTELLHGNKLEALPLSGTVEHFQMNSALKLWNELNLRVEEEKEKKEEEREVKTEEVLRMLKLSGKNTSLLVESFKVRV